MIYVYDILVNLSDSIRVYDFFEWKKTDVIEQVRKIPLVKVNRKMLRDLFEKEIKIDKDYLEMIAKKTEIYQSSKIKVIDYLSLFTDGFKVVAVEFDENGKSLFKSVLLLDEEEEILEIADELSLIKIVYNTISEHSPVLYLTRKEEKIRRYLLKELHYTYQKKLKEKINYLYEEIFSPDNLTIKEKYQKLILNIEEKYDKRYQKLYEILRIAHTNSKK